MHTHLPLVLFAQLPIPPLGPAPIRGNVPLASAYLTLWARHKGLHHFYDLQLVPTAVNNTYGDRAVARYLAERRPAFVGFSCYLWNIERTLFVAQCLKALSPTTRIVLGGPEITADNAWVLEQPGYDFAVIGEGEQTFAQLLLALLEGEAEPAVPIAGLYMRQSHGYDPTRLPAFRTPLPNLNRLGSPYLAGLLDAADEQLMLLETTRGCVFNCKFCYYPKSYDKQYYLDHATVAACLRHAVERGAHEVVLLDPTLNQRKDFAEFLRLLAAGNPGQGFRYFGELRGEGITAETAQLLRAANFTEVEVGLQSIGTDAMALMDRKNNLKAFERGVKWMLAEGIGVKVDLIIGLPGDTAASVRTSLRYLAERGLYSDVQVFNLAVLPGTAFRHEAASLGLQFQPRPPYYVHHTPTLGPTDLFELMFEAQELFAVEFDAPLPPELDLPPLPGIVRVWHVDLDRSPTQPPPADVRAVAFTVWLRGTNADAQRTRAVQCVRQLLAENPHTTLQVIVETTADGLSERLLEGLLAVCQEVPTYLDKFYALQPGRANGAKRIVAVLPAEQRGQLRPQLHHEWLSRACLVWRGLSDETDLEADEFAWSGSGQLVGTT
jgi:hypothetical protein